MSDKNIVFDTDVVVVGSGVAGALVARQLARSGLKVTILEAGETWQREDAVQRYQNSWNRTLTAPYQQAHWTTTPADPAYFAGQGNPNYQPSFLKGVGGSTWHWTGITPRFLPSDFELRSRYGKGEDWPISYDELEPYYVQAEQALGVAGDSENDHGSPRSEPYPMPAIPMTYGDKVIGSRLSKSGVNVAALPAARNSRNYDGRPSCRGNNTCTPLCPIGAAYSADVDVAKAVSAGAQLLAPAVVYRFDVDEKQNITTAHYKRADGSTHQVTARRFVLACNSIETARLLLMSGSDSAPDGLANSSGQVGCNLMDHTIFVSKFTMPEPLYIGRGPQSVSTILSGRDGSFRKHYAAAKFFLGNDLNIHQEAALLLENDKNWIHTIEKLKKQAIYQGQIGAEIEQLPDHHNRVQLDTKRVDPLGLPLPMIDYTLSAYSQRGVKHWSTYVRRLIHQMDGQHIKTSTSLSSHHPSGTTRMGKSPKKSVVNVHCQSHDHPNLFIAGGSVFPAMGTANPTLTIAALSLRLADYLLHKSTG
ncbi:MAG: GMC family oxidoreductase [Mariprofundus sp.]|nr:GMC family oxidoreductase [Mariprofundus sp.]